MYPSLRPIRREVERAWRRSTAAVGVLFHVLASGQSTTSLSGHVLDAVSLQPIEAAGITALPSSTTAFTDATGQFQFSISDSVDSLLVRATGYATRVFRPPFDKHIDLSLQPLAFDLAVAEVATMSAPEAEAVALPEGDLMQSLAATPGLASLDLGTGLVQPVVRGLYGSRVAVLEDGVPQQGARWGADHGALIDPDLYAASAWVPGAGQIQLGPESQGGGLRFRSSSWTGTPKRHTTTGTTFRTGDLRTKFFARHARSDAEGLTEVGGSYAVFGDRNIPQTAFTYLGRTYALPEARLLNTAGRAGHAMALRERPRAAGGTFKWVVRAADVQQGLFPGIIGVPMQQDLAPGGSLLDVELPQQRASRLTATCVWTEAPVGRALFRSHTASVAWNRRLELAPPHAHVWGPKPTSPVSLALNEWTAFAEGLYRGAHGQVGWQVEALSLQATGWEFLVPDHQRLRVSSWWSGARWSVRLDGVAAAQNAHEEPLYNAEGAVVGTDVRSTATTWLVPGGVVSFAQPFRLGAASRGHFTLAVSTRAPSNYEWGAHGIHHGTFRFEQGNPDLRSEQTAEGRAQLEWLPIESPWEFHLQGFMAIHRNFIHLTPTAAFAAIAHAGQVYGFRAAHAFRSGAEATVLRREERGTWTLDASVLGQWELATGLGLPFTTPAQTRIGWEGGPAGGPWSVSAGVKGIAPARLVARNEEETPGAVLLDAGAKWERGRAIWSVQGHNLLNAAWLDHSSNYRALGMAAQGRWIAFSLRLKIEHQSP